MTGSLSMTKSESVSEAIQKEEPRRRTSYLIVFVLLAIFTAIEVGVTYLPLPRIQVLVPIAIVKAALVALYYMHLRYDKRVFSAVFLMGLLMGFMLLISLILLFAPQPLDM